MSEAAASRNRAWYSKASECLRRNRNQVEPLAACVDQPGVEYFAAAPRRVLRVLKPELRSEKFYDPAAAANRPESLADNFYSRWARRPHPSANCRCSFRNSASRTSSHEEQQIVSLQIDRIRTSLREAEISGRDIGELERTLQVVDLSRLGETVVDGAGSKEARLARTDRLDECAKRKIVRDLDRYISELLDEILNDTIRAAIERERRDVVVDPTQPTFDVSFTFRGSADAAEVEKGAYVNRGFAGTVNDPDTLDCCLRSADAAAALLDCLDSGINSVETVELQMPEMQLQDDEERNLEQSLMDIIDAKLGGSSIGKSLEDLGMEIDAEDATLAKTKESSESPPVCEAIAQTESAADPLESRKSTNSSAANSRAISAEDHPLAERGSRSLDTIEEPPFNSLRLEFKRSSNSSAPEEDPKQQQTVGTTSYVNKTVSVIRQRLATRLASSHSQRNDKPPKSNKKNSEKKKSNDNNNKSKKKSDGNNVNSAGSNNANNSERPHSRTLMRAALELQDYRRRFPVPETSRRNNNNEGEGEGEDEDEVTLRNRKPTIVFLHGFGSSAESFEPQLNYFADLGYPCVAPDLLGHGFSSAPCRPKDYHFDKLLKDLEAVLLHYAFKPGRKCVLVAHNYGCSFAAALASKYTSNVHQLVLISGGGPTPLAPPPAEGAGHCCIRASLAPFLVCGMNRAVLYSARGRQHPYCGSEELEEQWPSHMRHVLRGMSWPDGDYVFHRRICTPTLLIHGLRDNKVSLVQECQMERTMIKAFLEAIPSAGNMPMTDCPEQLNHMINCFIDLWKNKKW